MIVEATNKDADRLEKFLAVHAETSMFLRGNLNGFGIGQSDHPHATRFFVEEMQGKIRGVGAITNSGMLMLQAPEGVGSIAPILSEAIPNIDILAGITGHSTQVVALIDAMKLGDIPRYLDEVEPLFKCDLADLVMPNKGNMYIRQPGATDLTVMYEWRKAYNIETLGSPDNADTDTQAKAQAESMIANGQSRLLISDNQPVCMTGFNAAMPDSVQIGGVYTPPDLRNNGFARLVVALHLDEVRQNGVARAILFAANEAASRAYRAIGFEQIGQYTIILFNQSKVS